MVPTSATGSKACAPRRLVVGAGAPGFTLIEMLMVLALIALIASLVSVNLIGRLDSVKVSRAAKDVASALRSTRAEALVKGQQRVLEVDIERRTITAPGRPPLTLPDGVDVTLRTATVELIDEGRGGIRFFPDGGSTGGAIELHAGERTWAVNVSWLTGEIEFEQRRGAAR